ncbi:MAG TPA: phytanoyl-CoA dioxygenase family protein [Allosphingosinicella sp.]|nr:phytanoyl-CoA dioxygenase family protein [Allosphingosinicella sp.]
MRLDPDGAQHFPAAFGPAEAAALAAPLSLPRGRPGARLGAVSGLAGVLAPADAIAAGFLGPAARPVGARLFDKSPARNWALGWHQDRTVAVVERRDVPGFGQWTVKAGIAHCVPPFGILERSLTLRIHLDPAGEDNAPLLVAPGSHRLGAIAEPAIAAAVRRFGARACLAAAGDVWAYATPILHASARASAPGRRRVLQILYSAESLPGGLRWLGV